MTRLIRVASWEDGTQLNVVFVHGLGGDAYNTWRADENSFWPIWLSRDLAGLATWTLSYEAPLTNWTGTAMPIQDRARNVLEALLSERELKGKALAFVCHSLGGLVIKQVLRVADGRRSDATARALVDSVKGVVFFATPHSGSTDATWFDRLRAITWPSASTLDLVRNSANLRDLNIWYRERSATLPQKVFYEKRGTAAGIIVADDSSDPGLPNVDPIGIDADHITICKPTDSGDLVYVRTRDFFSDQVLPNLTTVTNFGSHRVFNLPALPRPSSNRRAPVIIRLGILFIISAAVFASVWHFLRWQTPPTIVADSVKVQTIAPRPGTVFHGSQPADIELELIYVLGSADRAFLQLYISEVEDNADGCHGRGIQTNGGTDIRAIRGEHFEKVRIHWPGNPGKGFLVVGANFWKDVEGRAGDLIKMLGPDYQVCYPFGP
jgi:pimeloyl-ACP methyl ester carboxylesterase